MLGDVVAKPKGQMSIVVYAEVIGHQTLGRLEEVVFDALARCESIAPIKESMKVKETWFSRLRYWCRRQRGRLRGKINARSKEEWRDIIITTVKIVGLFVGPTIAAVVIYFLNIWLGK